MRSEEKPELANNGALNISIMSIISNVFHGLDEPLSNKRIVTLSECAQNFRMVRLMSRYVQIL